MYYNNFVRVGAAGRLFSYPHHQTLLRRLADFVRPPPYRTWSPQPCPRKPACSLRIPRALDLVSPADLDRKEVSPHPPAGVVFQPARWAQSSMNSSEDRQKPYAWCRPPPHRNAGTPGSPTDQSGGGTPRRPRVQTGPAPGERWPGHQGVSRSISWQTGEYAWSTPPPLTQLPTAPATLLSFDVLRRLPLFPR